MAWKDEEESDFVFAAALLTCHLFSSAVRELAGQGWSTRACKTVSIRRDPDEKLSVAITSEEALLFRARSVVLSAARVGLVSSSV